MPPPPHLPGDPPRRNVRGRRLRDALRDARGTVLPSPSWGRSFRSLGRMHSAVLAAGEHSATTRRSLMVPSGLAFPIDQKALTHVLSKAI
jgi:hypothetical protein